MTWRTQRSSYCGFTVLRRPQSARMHPHLASWSPRVLTAMPRHGKGTIETMDLNWLLSISHCRRSADISGVEHRRLWPANGSEQELARGPARASVGGPNCHRNCSMVRCCRKCELCRTRVRRPACRCWCWCFCWWWQRLRPRSCK